MSRKHTGICHICGKEGELTFEHIPPRNALNNQSAKMYSGDGLIKRMQGEKSKYEIQQAGAFPCHWSCGHAAVLRSGCAAHASMVERGIFSSVRRYSDKKRCQRRHCGKIKAAGTARTAALRAVSRTEGQSRPYPARPGVILFRGARQPSHFYCQPSIFHKNNKSEPMINRQKVRIILFCRAASVQTSSRTNL